MDIEQTKYRLKVFQKRVLKDSFWFRIMRENPNGNPKWKIKYVQIGMKVDLFPDDIIEQCTGIKDKNGTLIYEGDILYPCYVIRKQFNGYMLPTGKQLDFSNGNFYNGTCEIIGNIHENPELVKE